MAITKTVSTKMTMDHSEFATAVKAVVGETKAMAMNFKKQGKKSTAALKDINKSVKALNNGVTTAKDSLGMIGKGLKVLKQGFEFMKQYSKEARELEAAMKGVADGIGNAVAQGPRFKALMKDMSAGFSASSDAVSSLVSGLIEGALWMRDIGESALLTSIYLGKAVVSIGKAGWKGAMKAGAKSVAAGEAPHTAAVKAILGGYKAAWTETEAQVDPASDLMRYRASLAARDTALAAKHRPLTLPSIDLRKTAGGRGSAPGAAQATAASTYTAPLGVDTNALYPTLGGEHIGSGIGLSMGEWQGAWQEKFGGDDGTTQIISDAEEVDTLLGSMTSHTEELSTAWEALSDVATATLGGITSGLSSAVSAAIKGEVGWKKAMVGIAISLVDSTMEMALARGTLEFGLGLAAAAVGNVAGAAGHFAASGVLLSIGAGAAIGSAAITASGARGESTPSTEAAAGAYSPEFGTNGVGSSGPQMTFNIDGNVLGSRDALGTAVIDAVDHVQGRGFGGS